MVVVHGHIVGDFVEPGGKGNFTLEALQFFESLEKDLLGVIFGVVSIMKKFQPNIENPGLMASHNVSIDVDLSLEDTFHQEVVIDFFHVPSSSSPVGSGCSR